MLCIVSGFKRNPYKLKTNVLITPAIFPFHKLKKNITDVSVRAYPSIRKKIHAVV